MSAIGGATTSAEVDARLQLALGWTFKDHSLLDRALTHRSFCSENNVEASNERLEFLGDSVLGCAITELLFQRHPDLPEGKLSRIRAGLIREESLARLGRELGIAAFLRLDESTARNEGAERPSILADALEAVYGAVFLDGGYQAAKAFVERYWADRMRKPARPLRDPKTVLQEWAQARGLPTPSYREVERTGPHHDPLFRVAVLLPEREPAEGRGRSKRAAEQAAAAALLAREGVRADA